MRRHEVDEVALGVLLLCVEHVQELVVALAAGPTYEHVGLLGGDVSLNFAAVIFAGEIPDSASEVQRISSLKWDSLKRYKSCPWSFRNFRLIVHAHVSIQEQIWIGLLTLCLLGIMGGITLHPSGIAHR